MENISTTIATNVVTISGVLTLALNAFGLDVLQDEVQQLIGFALAFLGVIMNWHHRWSKGDITLAGIRK